MMNDALQRDMAVNVAHSFIVQAPAGSGKTELLIQRMLALLAQVEKPQQILAITFTNKAAIEMQQRLLGSLSLAWDQERPPETHAAKTWDLAKAVLDRHGDTLLRNPGQLSIQTIDSFNATLVRKMPWTSRFGAMPEISDDPESLYQRAVEQLLTRMNANSSDSEHLEVLLRHLDNQAVELQRMLIAMLRRRDQWLGLLFQNVECSHEQLQQAVEGLCRQHLRILNSTFPAQLTEELLTCARFAAANLEGTSIARLHGLEQLPGSEFIDLPLWQAFSDLLLTTSGQLRKRVNVNQGFPSGAADKAAKEKMQQLLDDLSHHPAWVQQLSRVVRLPQAGYSPEQWLVLQSLIQILPLVVAELWLVFRAEGQVDFIEIALKAIQSLGAADNPSQLLLQIDQDLKHILVDEFQDTSRLQYRLLQLLISGWHKEEGRTLFLVGDPMQSIYRFREAEVGLFLRSFRSGFDGLDHELMALQLTSNFRSQQGLVDWVNNTFRVIFPERVDLSSGAVPLTQATSVKSQQSGHACQIFPYIGRADREEAKQVLSIIQQIRAESPEQTIAILVRGRTHLREILPLLQENKIAYQAQDIDLLGARPAALDVVHLTRALLHRADRLSWLAVLRAPWCGLTLQDLHALLSDYPGKTVPGLLLQPVVRQKLSADGQLRLERVWPILHRGLERHGRISLRSLVEGCWLAMGAPACYSNDALADAQLVFELLDKLDRGGDLASFDQFERGLNGLFAAPDSRADGKLQIMTIHKAKGLEFDRVIIPGLGRMPKRQDSPLLLWLDHPELGLVMAPVSAKGSQEKDPLYRLLAQLEMEKADQESSRLLYVAATRAIRHLYLLGHAQENSQGELVPQKGSLLEKLWPVVQGEFYQQGQRSKAGEREFTCPHLHKLPADWAIPALSTVSLPILRGKASASEEVLASSGTETFSGWEDPVHRHTGTVLHRQLDKAGKQGGRYWTDYSSKERQVEISRSLSLLGVRGENLVRQTEKIWQALDRCLRSDRGRWILADHPDQASEFPLTGIIDGAVIHAVIDRTFIAEGYRWVIDYKTSSPKAGESMVTFFKREAAHYQKQLNMYAQLFALSEENIPVKTALYFPLVDGWYEL